MSTESHKLPTDPHDHKAESHTSIIDAMIAALPDEPEQQTSDNFEEDMTLSDRDVISELPKHFDGWPQRHVNRSVDPKDPVDDRAWKWWEAYDTAFHAAKSGALIVIYGGHGSGKTQMCMEIAKKLPDRFFPAKKEGAFTLAPIHRPLLYRKAMEFFNDIRSTYGANRKETERDVINRYADAALVVIDEAHQRGEKEFEDRQLTLMLDKRYDAMLPTILVTNLTREDFYATLSPAVKSRMIETAEGIEANWRSFRSRKTT
jgi:DNA replication protein DnaC